MGSALFWLQAANSGHQQLNHAVTFQRAKRDDFGRCTDNDPGNRAVEDCVYVHEKCHVFITLVTFQGAYSLGVVVQTSVDFAVMFPHVGVKLVDLSSNAFN